MRMFFDKFEQKLFCLFSTIIAWLNEIICKKEKTFLVFLAVLWHFFHRQSLTGSPAPFGLGLVLKVSMAIFDFSVFRLLTRVYQWKIHFTSIFMKSDCVDFNLLVTYMLNIFLISHIFLSVYHFKIQLYKIWPISVVC